MHRPIRTGLAEEEASFVAGDWAQVRFPSAARDGDWLAVSVNASEDIAEGWELRVLHLTEGNSISLGHGYDASWSPNGGSLYYEVHTPSVELVRRDLSSGAAEPLGLEGARDRTVEVSPTGTHILFTCGRESLMLHSLEDQATVRLTDDVSHDRFGSFSPDASLVLFYRQDESDGVALSIVACEVETGRTLVLEEGPVREAAFAPDRPRP